MTNARLSEDGPNGVTTASSNLALIAYRRGVLKVQIWFLKYKYAQLTSTLLSPVGYIDFNLAIQWDSRTFMLPDEQLSTIVTVNPL